MKLLKRKKYISPGKDTQHPAITLFFDLQLSLDLYYTEDEIYELSYAREPRNHRAPVSFSH